MKGMKFAAVRRLFTALLAMCLMTAAVGSLPVHADRFAELEAELKRLQQQETQIKNNLSSAKTDLSSSQYRKNQLDAQIDNVCAQIDLLQSKLDTINSEIAANEAVIQQAEADIEQKKAAITETHTRLGQRLSRIAKSGNVTAIQRLMNTDNYTDYLLKSKAAACIARRDQQTMDELEAALVEIRAQQTELEGRRGQLDADKAAVEKLKKETNDSKKKLDTLFAAAQTEVRNLQNTVSEYNQQLKQKQKEIEAADAAIEALIRGTGTTGKFNGKLMYWPVPTVRTLSSSYGPRWGTIHKGIDIANGPIPIYGENIVAAADGTVIQVNKTNTWGSGWSAGYGYCVIIDHGEDSKGRIVSTLYAHCSKVFAYVGQRVTGGKTVIAQAGRTGNVTGPHLHFEVRLDGKHTNPMDGYVDPKYN